MKPCRSGAFASGKKLCQGIALAGGLLLLVACDDGGQKTAVAQADGPTNSATQAKRPDAAALAVLAKRDAGKPLALLDASELQLDGASAMVLTFSLPLDPNQDFAARVHLVDSVSGKIDGAWELSDNLMELRLRHLQPNRKLVLTVEGGLKAVNGAELGQQQQQTLATRDIKPSVGFAGKGSLLPTKLAQGYR
ncbi:Uncharacterised protein [Serratia plymuthica]|uniref:Alpha-2-macroglobulin MG1 domain-containing protein n=1 Tax=Serratia plymuthica TaxID=82996 RepID=A0A2X4V0G0_SERPL|nr:Uncharacterised protein [Serratia plymuthica]